MRPVSRPAAVTLVCTAAATMAVTVATANGTLEHDQADRVVGYGQIRYRGLGPERWAARYRAEHREVAELRRQLRRERRVLLEAPSVVEAINLASAVYGNGPTLWRKARCETGGTFNPRAANPSGAAGLFQFLGSTWASTPFAGFSVWSPYANALAAGWMHAHGRGGEWSCR